MKRTHKILVAVAAAVVLLAIFMRLSGKKAEAGPHQDVALQPAAVAVAKRTPIIDSLTLSGDFVPYQQIDVHAKVAGYIQHIYVDVGDQIKEGQVMAILEVPELTAQVLGADATIKRNEDSIHRAESEVQSAESSHSAAHFAYTRLKQASDARPGLIAEQELDDALAKDQEAEADVASAKAALSEAQNELSVSQASLKQLAAMEAYTKITAPFAGVITKRYADTGSLIQAGTASNTQAMPVVQLAEWSRMRLVVPVPESAVPFLRLGSSVQVHVSALNQNFDGRIARFADALDSQTRTMHTEIDVENPHGALKDGMYAEVKLDLHHQANALTVPIEALDRDSSGVSVWVVGDDGRIQKRKVKLGAEDSNRVEVLSGVLDNERVVIGNHSELYSGEKVEPKLVVASAEGAGGEN